MKKITIPILAITFLILSGCYKGDDTVTVKINLQNLHAAKSVAPVSFLAKLRSFFVKNAFAAGPDIFIAAEKDTDILATLSVNQSEIANNGNTVEMEVPAGDNITILVVKTVEGTAAYYDYKKVNLEAGKTSDVSITLNLIETWNIYEIETNCSAPYVKAGWDKSGVYSGYIIQDYSTGETLYKGTDNEIQINDYMIDIYLYVEFKPFNIKTSGFYFNTGGC